MPIATQAVTLISEKFRLKLMKSLSHTVLLTLKQKRKRINSPYSCVFVASATALGLSLYLAHKNKIKCDAIELNLERTDDNENNVKIYDEAICRSRDLLQRVKDECGAPGIVVGVSVDGKTIWSEGLGYADVENRVLCSADTVMRIASISKSITMAAVAKLWEEGKLDLDKPVQDYVPYFPQKSYNGKPVVITCRHLVSHLGGIRHYDKNSSNVDDEKDKAKHSDDKSKTSKSKEFEYKEYYIKEKFKDVKSSLYLFKDDPLVAKPGTKFVYSTHGWTLISAIVEAATKEQFHVHMTKLFKKLGMKNTYLDVNDILIYHRSRNYLKDNKGCLINAPYVDNSYKWAGGGFLSTVGDLLQFANAMLYSHQSCVINFLDSNVDINLNLNIKDKSTSEGKEIKSLNNETDSVNKLCDGKLSSVQKKQPLPGYLNSNTVEAIWAPVIDHKEAKYGMGWLVYPEKQECEFCEKNKFCVYHTGGAVGASSVLFIMPKKVQPSERANSETKCNPKGIVVAILTNLQAVNLTKTALKIAEIFENELPNT